jgi:hypothetical protein
MKISKTKHITKKGIVKKNPIKRISAKQYEEKIFDAQYKVIKKEYGAKIANSANIGWSIDGQGKTIDVSSKLYNGQILRSYYRNGQILHEFNDSDE